MPPETGQFTNQTYFPEEVMIQILVRLPPKSLLRFKSVCKTWYALIGSSFFVTRHLDFNKTMIIDKEFCHLLHFEKPITTPTMAGAAILLGPTNEIRELEGAPCLEGDHQLGLHGRMYSVSRYGYTGIGDGDDEGLGFHTWIWGLVKGVYCIMIKGVRSNRCTLVLWNPGNRQVHVLPELPAPVFPPQIVEFLEEGNTFGIQTLVCGFGYNPSTNDHMVMLVSMFGDELDDFYHHCTFHLYSLNSNTWKVLDPFEIVEDTSLLEVYDHGGIAFVHNINHSLTRAWNDGVVYLNGACHLRISTGILSFDFEDVCFRVTLSTTGTTLEGKYLWLATADGQLAVVCTPEDVKSHLSHEFDVYVMEKNDAESSWVRAYSVILTSLSPGAFIGIVDDEFFVREDNASGRVVSYRLGAAEPEKEGRVYCCVDDEWVSVLPYRGSLLSIKPGNNS